MNVRTATELGRALRAAIEVADTGNIPAIEAATGVKADTIRRWCRGENEPGAIELGRVAKVLAVSLDALVFDCDLRPAVLAPAAGWSFSEKQLAELLEGFRALDRLNRLVGHRIDVVATYCAAPKGTLAAIESGALEIPPQSKTPAALKSSQKDTKTSEYPPKRKRG
jgi:transcriptional regulator with XRE-family HTH domain